MKKVFDLNKRSYLFSKEVVLFINKLDCGKFQYPIITQLLRSATSIGANIIEASSGMSRKIMIVYYSIALRSANETKYWLCLIRDTIDIDNKTIKELIQEADEISKIIAKIIISTRSN